MSKAQGILEQMGIEGGPSGELEKQRYTCPKCGYSIMEIGPENPNDKLICPHDGASLEVDNNSNGNTNDQGDTGMSTEESKNETLVEKLKVLVEQVIDVAVESPSDFEPRVLMALAGENDSSDLEIAQSSFGNDSYTVEITGGEIPALTPEMRAELADIFGSDASMVSFNSNMLNIPFPSEG